MWTLGQRHRRPTKMPSDPALQDLNPAAAPPVIPEVPQVGIGEFEAVDVAHMALGTYPECGNLHNALAA